MPTVYIYDETRVDYFITDDYGLITGPEAVIEPIDLGNISELADPIELDELQFNINDYGFVTRIADVQPFGTIRASGITTALQSYSPAVSGPILVSGTGKESRTRSTWIGSGTLFEIGGGLERLVIPDFGAAGPSPTITGQGLESNIVNYKGNKAQFSVSSSAQTREFNVYPVFSTVTFTVTGGTSQEYPNEYIQSIVQEQLVGKSQNSISYNYELTEIVEFNEEDWGLLTDRNGSSFDNPSTTFGSTTPKFSDALVVENVILGNIADIPTEFEDYGIVSTSYKFGRINTTKNSAYGTKGNYSKSFDYIGSGSISVDPSPTTPDLDTDRTRSFRGSGSININGQLGLGQAPQHRVFGLEGRFTINGACTQRFIPRPVRGSGITIFSSESKYRKVLNPPENKQLFQIYGYVDNVQLIFFPSRNTLNLKLSGQATKLQLFKSYRGSDKLKFSGELTNREVRFAPHWRSPLERDGYIEPVDYGFINESPTESNEDWGWVREIPLSIAGGAGMDFGYIIPLFRAITLVGIGAESFVRDTYIASGSLTVSDPAYVTPAFAFESSGKSGIATHNAGFFFSGQLGLGQAPQHRVFGVGDYIVVSGTGNESITPAPEIGSGIVSISGAYSDLKFTSGAGEETILSTISGSANERFIPNFNGSGSIVLRQGREEGQTYLRIINEDPARPAILFSVYNNLSISEKNTESYNSSSIRKGGAGSEDYGTLGSTPSYGFDLSYQGTGSGALTSTFDNESNTYDQDIISGSRYSDDLLGSGLLPTFDKTSQYEINFSSTNVTEDYGRIALNTVGGNPYDQYLYPYYTGFSDQDGIDKGYEDLGFLNEDPNESAKLPFGTIFFQQPTFANISRIIPKYPGQGTLVVSGTAEEKFSTGDSSTELFVIGGSANEAYSAQTPENTQLFEYSGSRESESVSFTEIGSGLIARFGAGIDAITFAYLGVESNQPTISGSALVRTSLNPPENTQLFQIYAGYSDLAFVSTNVAEKATLRLLGELNHPNIDYTPHYGIDRNVGIETGIFILPGGAGGEYGNPGIVTTRFLPQYPGGFSGGGTAGPIKLSDKAIARTNAPIVTDGTIYILGIGTAANGDLDGVEIGATWRVIPASIVAGRPGLISIKGNALSREIQVYASYGDLRTPGTSGIITISTEKRKTEEKSTFRYGSSGSISISGSLSNERKTKKYQGRGTLFTLSSGTPSRTKSFVASGSISITGTAKEKFSSVGISSTILFTIGGAAKKSVRLTTDFGGTLRLSGSVGNIGDPIRTKSFRGSGKYSTLSGASWSRTRPSAATTVLIQVGGSAETREIQVYGYYGDLRDPGTSGTITIYGELTHPQIDFTPAYKASGLFTISGIAKPVSIRRILDIGGTVNISGSAGTKFVTQAGEGTVLFNIIGSANTRELNVYQGYPTTGLFTISGISANREIQVYGYYGDQKNPGTSGIITISGRTLVHPEVRYIPSPDGSGTIFVQGSAQPRRIYPNYPGFGTLFTLSSVKESYTRTTYIGIGNVTLSSNALTEIAEFEEPRTYVVII